MVDRTNLASVQVGRYHLTLAKYDDNPINSARPWPLCYFNHRNLRGGRPGRHAFDVGKYAVLIERYYS